jgi:hypothetical protein
MECACSNIPDTDYPNVLDVAHGDGLISHKWSTGPGVGRYQGNMFPTTFPVRCQACGKNVTLVDGSKGSFPCAPEGEDWLIPTDSSANHKTKLDLYTKTFASIPYWWVKDVEVGSKCPRAIDCPDWHYEGEKNYSKMMDLIKSIGKVVDINKVVIGFSTVDSNALVQAAVTDNPGFRTDLNTTCTQNMSCTNWEDGKRCEQPLLTQAWGLKFNPFHVTKFEDMVLSELGKTLKGVGLSSIDGVLNVQGGQPVRMWTKALCTLVGRWSQTGTFTVQV